jgi:hypothetical protein
MNIINLPTELVIEIFNCVNYVNLLNLSETCKFFYDIITSFSWKQLCMIKTPNMPTNIQFANYFIHQTHHSFSSEIENFCCNKLLVAKPFSTAIITNVCANKIFFNYLQRTTCTNVIIMDHIDTLCNEETCRNFNFYFRHRSSRMLSLFKILNITFCEYNLKSHMKIFGNVNEYYLLDKLVPNPNIVRIKLNCFHPFNNGDMLAIRRNAVVQRTCHLTNHRAITPIDMPGSKSTIGMLKKQKINFYVTNRKNPKEKYINNQKYNRKFHSKYLNKKKR